MILRKSDEEHFHEEMTLCIIRMCQMQVIHKKDYMNRIQYGTLLTKERNPPIRLMESKTLHESQCENRFLVVKHEGNHPINNQ
jgi:hypothetical protein